MPALQLLKLDRGSLLNLYLFAPDPIPTQLSLWEFSESH